MMSPLRISTPHSASPSRPSFTRSAHQRSTRSTRPMLASSTTASPGPSRSSPPNWGRPTSCSRTGRPHPPPCPPRPETPHHAGSDRFRRTPFRRRPLAVQRIERAPRPRADLRPRRPLGKRQEHAAQSHRRMDGPRRRDDRAPGGGEDRMGLSESPRDAQSERPRSRRLPPSRCGRPPCGSRSRSIRPATTIQIGPARPSRLPQPLRGRSAASHARTSRSLPPRPLPHRRADRPTGPAHPQGRQHDDRRSS